MRTGTGIALIAGLLLPLAGCANLPVRPPPGDPATCRAAFAQYDLAVSLFQPYSFTEESAAQNPAISRAGNQIMSAGCLTGGDDIQGMAALQMKLGPRQPVNSGPAIPPTAVHVGILTGGFSDTGRATAFFESQGYHTRTIGAEKLGRRLYIGPITSQGALDRAIALAAEAGFPSAYPSDLFRFWRF
jgi:hypothetical protein